MPVVTQSIILDLPLNGFQSKIGTYNLEFLIIGCYYVETKQRKGILSNKKFRIGIMVNSDKMTDVQQKLPYKNKRYILYTELPGVDDYSSDLPSRAVFECREKIDRLESQLTFLKKDEELSSKLKNKISTNELKIILTDKPVFISNISTADS